MKKMHTVLRMSKPYREIPKLPELCEKFMDCYSDILEKQSAPVMDSIHQDQKRIMDELDTKLYKDKRIDFYKDSFGKLLDGAEHCNNVTTLRSFADKAEALKLRFLNEMDAEDKRLAEEAAAKAEAECKRQEEESREHGEVIEPTKSVASLQPIPKMRTTRNISIKTVAQAKSWRLESAEDVDRYLTTLRENLLKEVDEDTIVNIEL